MINCIVCMKYVPNTFESINSDIKRDGIVGKINPADMFAIEEAVRIKEKHGGNSVGVCMGLKSAEDELKSAIAIGLDEVYLLSDKALAGSDTLATSYALSKCIETIGEYNLILCGKQSTDGDTGQVGQEIASHLDLPCITNVVEICFDNDNSITCKVLDDTRYIHLKTKLPAVVCVLKGINEPRIPTISGFLKARNFSVKTVSSSDVGIDLALCGLTGSPTKVKHTTAHKFAERASIDITTNYVEELSCIITQNKSLDDSIAIETITNSDNTKQGDEIWVVPEIINGIIADVSLEILSKAKELALISNRILSVIVVGAVVQSVADCLCEYGVDKIYLANKQVERYSESNPLTLAKACKVYKPSVLLLGSTVWGKWMAPNVAVRLQTGLTADCIDLNYDNDNENLIQARIAFGGSVLAKVYTPNNRPQMATIRKGVFTKVVRRTTKPPQIIDIENLFDLRNRIETLSCKLQEGKKDGVNLMTSNIILTGGNGVDKKNFPLLHKLAELVGGEVGATRCAVDARWIDYEHQIGQTGLTVKPKLLIAFGISGASEHLVGMRDAECIVSVNTDTNAPILAVSDYRIMADCGRVIKSLIEKYERMIKLS